MFDTTIIMVRHAQGEGNLKGEFHGQYPSDLTPLGFSQAECTAKYLEAFPIDIAFASDIPRAYTTAKIIADKHGLRVTKEEGLREIYGGVWETMKFDDIVVKYPEEYDIWKNDLGNCTCPGGESVRHLADRVQKCVERLVRENAGKTTLLNNLRQALHIQRLDVGHVRHLRVRHDGRRIRVYQDNLIPQFPQRLAPD